MFNFVLKKVKNILIDSSLDYNRSNSYFVFVSNLFFKINGQSHRFEITGLGDFKPNFKVVDYKTGDVKFFGYRKQGLMAFGNGVRQRGIHIGNEYLLDEITFSKNDIVIDIGANTGDLKIYFDNKNLNINYFGFEPGLIEFESLKVNNQDGNVFQIALGDINGLASFYYKPEFGDSSLVEMDGFSKSYEVEVIKLATFIENRSLSSTKIKLVKLEAEGFEPEIIFGIGKYLESIEYISADLGFERGINQETTAPTVLNFLLSSGFEIIKINGGRFVFLLKNKNFKN
jgi:FkbM family methyltransferase